jgi:hypothetical protein
VLRVLAQADAPGMGTDGLAEFCRKQNHCENLIHPREAASVRLRDIDGITREKLLEHDAIVRMFTGAKSCPMHEPMFH